jgi:aerobic-type carbon monoxide dehydrogenase small subunit (CoxS/CutS family)
MQRLPAETIEWLAKNGKPHPLQKAFTENRAAQRGFCKPGMIIIVKPLLGSDNNPDERGIRRALSLG